MNSNFDNIMFFGTLIIYCISNIVISIAMCKCKKIQLKLLFAILPLPLLFFYYILNLLIYKLVVDFDNLPLGTDYGGYFTGLVIIMGLIMVIFYLIDIIYVFIFVMRKRKNK